jgi:hypothetical protein
MLECPVGSCSGSSRGFRVLAELRGGASATPERLGQSSIEGDMSSLSSGPAAYSIDSSAEARNIYDLVARAQKWLLRQTPRMYPMNGVTPSIYWAIRSLASLYSAQISLAQSGGLPSLSEIEEEEWPDKPSGEDSLDLSRLPDWLCFILLLDELHLPGLHAIIWISFLLSAQKWC